MATQQRSLSAMLAICAAAVAFFLSPVAGLLLGLAAVVLGVFGFLRSASPRVSGGMLSLLAIGLGLAAVVVKLVHGALRLLF